MSKMVKGQKLSDLVCENEQYSRYCLFVHTHLHSDFCRFYRVTMGEKYEY